jgi:hypothetical protein
VGYGYASSPNGSLALLDPADFPAVLAHAGGLATARADEETGFEVPLINRHAVDYLLRRGFLMDNFFAFYMSDAPLGKLENYRAAKLPAIPKFPLHIITTNEKAQNRQNRASGKLRRGGQLCCPPRLNFPTDQPMGHPASASNTSVSTPTAR